MRVVLCGTMFPGARDTLAPLLSGDAVDVVPLAHLHAEAPTADVLVPMMSPIDAGVIAVTSARLIQQWGAGLEGVDVEAASARGIHVANVPSDLTANAESTAEHALLLMLGTARRLHVCRRTFDEGAWGFPIGEALFGRRALIVGLGRVGRALARRLVAMGMAVDAIRRTPRAEDAAETGLDRIGSPADLLRFAPDADFVVCTASANGQSRGMIDAAAFGAMKPTAVLINVSRGAIVVEADLVAALRAGAIAGAGLDVFQQEPIGSSHPLLAMEQVLATPHVAGVTRQSYDGIARVVAANVRAVREGRPPSYCVNLDATRA